MTRKDIMWIIAACILIAVCLVGIYKIDLGGPAVPSDTATEGSVDNSNPFPSAGPEATGPNATGSGDSLVPGTTAPTSPSKPAEMTQVSVSKIWDDANDQDGKRPDSITIRLWADGVEVASKVVTAADGWSWTFTELNKFANGKQIVYTITEDAVEGYTAEFSGFNVTNSHAPETIDVSGCKVWNDANNQDGVRPNSVTVTLLADGIGICTETVTGENEWKFCFEDLPKYANGRLIEYTVVEAKVDGYECVADGFIITNTHTPERISISGSNIWNDADDQDGRRPESITIRLWADGVEVASKAVTAADGWSWTFAELDKFSNGKEIVYTITEDAVEGYITTVDGFHVTNMYEPEKIGIGGNNTWADANNQDGKRPNSITIRLWADGVEVASKVVTAADGWSWTFTELDKFANGKQIGYTITGDTVEGYTTVIDKYNVINHYTPGKTQVSGNQIWNDANDQDGKRPDSIIIRLWADGVEVAAKVVTAADNWSWNFTGLDVYAAGKKIIYTITEDRVEDYETVIDGFNVTNSRTPETIEITGETKWIDANNQDGKRPASITVNLFANEILVRTEIIGVEDGWKFVFKDLPKFANGRQVVYTVYGVKVNDYECSVDGFVITYTHTMEKTVVNGSVTWNDANNQDGKRPGSITVSLFANGQKVNTFVVTAANGWSWSFADLDKYANGKEIAYTITADAVEDYSTTIDCYNVINRHAPEKLGVSGNVIWDDANNQDGKRPVSITVHLLANGQKVNTIVVTAANGWSWSFANLDKYANGKEIAYTITADAVEDYSTTIDCYNVTNRHVPEKLSVSGNVIWDDANNQDGKRPASITVHLLANGQMVTSITVTAADGWSWSFIDLDKFANGVEILYTVTEDAVEGYTATVNGFHVTNTYVPPKIDEDILNPAYSIVLHPEASGVLVKSNTSAIIDYSNTVDGYVMVKFIGTSTARLKVQVIGPTTTYTYNIAAGQWEVLPLSDGEGTYKIRILENVVDNRYATILSLSTQVSLKDEFAPFIRPNQYVNYDNAPQTVTTAANLCRGKTKLLDKVDVIYDYVVKTISYDYNKAATVQSGYLPNLDAVLADKKGICFDYAALMTGMLRSQGIPCKLVVGYAGTEYHAWISVWSEETGWIDGAVYFDGKNWQRMDPTFVSASGGSQSILDFVANNANYTTKYLY